MSPNGLKDPWGEGGARIEGLKKNGVGNGQFLMALEAKEFYQDAVGVMAAEKAQNKWGRL